MVTLRLFACNDIMIKWFQKIDFWDEIVALRIEMVNGLLPMDIELNLKHALRSALDPECKIVLEKLIANNDGLSAEQLGIRRDEIKEILDDGDCACAKLVKLGLATIRNNKYFRATREARDRKIQALVFGSL